MESGVGAAKWLAGREPVPPRALRERVVSLAASVDEAAADPADTLLTAAESALRRLVRGRTSDRATALDLLAVDALVTYAFEAAASAPASVPARSADAMARLSAAAES